MRMILMMIATLCVMLAACEAKKPEPAKPTQAVARTDTKNLQAASMVGYDGKAIRSRVDSVLNKAEEANKASNEALK